MFGPPSLGRLPQQSASLFRAHIPPARGAETHSRSLDGFRRESTAREVEQFDGEIEESFRWKARLTHHAPEPSRSAGTEDA
jgi:hypothetical protein